MSRQVALLALLLVFGGPLSLPAYEPPTHRDIAERAVRLGVSSLDSVLQTELGFSFGIDDKFLSPSRVAPLPVTRLIGDGAEREDDPSFRSLRHFHNPLAAPWDGAGLFGRFQSSTLWQQNAGQHGIAGGGNWSWQDARDWYLKALTGSAPADRASAFGATFEALGHLTHLVQDASVPAHVRNDPHPILDGYERHVDRLQRAAPGSARRQRFESLLNAGPPFSPAPAFTPTGHPQASVPVARLIDSDTFLGGNFGVLTLPSLGIAEYTNGNFLSDDTLFTDFVFPRRSALGADFFEPEGAVVRRYFEKAFEGETVRHFVAESALYDPVTAILGQPAADALTLTRLVYEDYAAKLLPLAVRYSASLLDYFFRGRLDVDLVDDGSGLRLVGANASAEALDSGTLTVYADGTDGVRERASSGVGVGRVEPGGTLPAVTVAPPEGAERFVAVYTGALGEERPGGAFPGGVIGKVLGGVRVEEVFNDGTQWKLRTPKGVFGLATGLGPLTVAQYEVVKWGDTDSALVARTPLSASPPTVAVFDVLRQPGSSELAILSGGTDVVVTERKRVAFPSPVQLTTVNFTQTVVYRQHLARAEQATTYVWVPLPPPTYNPDVDGSYGPGSASFSPFTFEVAYEQTIPFNQSFPVRLDLPHNWDIGTVFAPYYWQLRDISVDAAGRPLGLVRVFLSQPQVAPVTVPVFKVNASGATEQYTTKTIAPYLPEQVTPLLWALVDLEQGRVVASTAEPTVTINSQVVDDQIDRSCCLGSRTFYVHSTLTYSGGPQNGTTVDSGWRAAGQILPTSVGGTIGTVTDVALPANGEQSLSLDGWLREDLRQAMLARGRYTIQPATVPDDFLFVYTCDPSNVCSAMRIQQPLGKLLQGPGRLLQAVRPRPVAGNQRIVFLALSFVSTRPRGNLGDLLVWDPDLSRAQFIGAGLGVGFHTLGSATGSAALVSSSFFAPSGRGTTLFRLDPTQASAFFANIDLTQAYTLLEPRHLYNTTDLKFHLLQPSLERTALPATLATLTNVAGHRARDYHSIRLLTP